LFVHSHINNFQLSSGCHHYGWQCANINLCLTFMVSKSSFYVPHLLQHDTSVYTVLSHSGIWTLDVKICSLRRHSNYCAATLNYCATRATSETIKVFYQANCQICNQYNYNERPNNLQNQYIYCNKKKESRHKIMDLPLEPYISYLPIYVLDNWSFVYSPRHLVHCQYPLNNQSLQTISNFQCPLNNPCHQTLSILPIHPEQGLSLDTRYTATVPLQPVSSSVWSTCACDYWSVLMASPKSSNQPLLPNVLALCDRWYPFPK
jgi:hypothetical protein